MRVSTLAACVVGIMASLVVQQPAQAAIVIDNFNGGPLNTNVWTALTNRHNRVCVDADNVDISADYLRLQVHRTSRERCPYLGARISSRGKYSVGHGYTRARIDFNTQQGSWQPFVLFGNCPRGTRLLRCGEVDAAEITEGMVHYRLWSVRRDDPDIRCGVKVDLPFNRLARFHIYGANVQPGFTSFFIDGERRARITKEQLRARGCTWPFDDANRRFTLRLGNTAGAFGGTPDPSGFPNTMRVDWVRHAAS